MTTTLKQPVIRTRPSLRKPITGRTLRGSGGGIHWATPAEIDAGELKRWLDGGRKVELVDVREPREHDIARLEGARLLPLGSIVDRRGEIDVLGVVVVFCKAGTRSARALELLVSAGFKRVKNLKGGINAWAKEVDPQLPMY